MLTVYSQPLVGKSRAGISRRSFLQAGGLCIGGLTLADVLRLQARGATDRRGRNKAVIMIYLPGGPSHIDMFDLKPDAPVEYRGEFRPIRTNVPGMDVCEHLPLHAKMADKLAIVRNMVFGNSFHNGPLELETGFGGKGLGPRPSRPGIGSVVSRIQRDAGGADGMPPYVALSSNMTGYPVYLGEAHKPFIPVGQFQTLALPKEMTAEKLQERTELLHAFDSLNRDLDRQRLTAHDAFTAQALEMITSNRARDAFDVSKEPDSARARYGSTGTALLQARRLVEAGVRVVSLSFSGVERGEKAGQCAGTWDNHGNIFNDLKLVVPRLDRALYALVTDLHDRGLDQDVAVVVWGEFGRTPKVGRDEGTGNRSDGRNHWTEAGFALMAGGGLKMGQVIGATDARGGRPVGGAYRPQNVLATLYHVLGIDPRSTLPDLTGRPIYLLDDPEPIKELV
ncbi:MAG: DUF1501 domain-containing protein [Planctomycetia bacterium]|nr:DUF1501 domain-containing protein [Planctomycetia bacterium]